MHDNALFLNVLIILLGHFRGHLKDIGRSGVTCRLSICTSARYGYQSSCLKDIDELDRFLQQNGKPEVITRNECFLLNSIL